MGERRPDLAGPADSKLAGVELEDELVGILTGAEESGVESRPMLGMTFALTRPRPHRRLELHDRVGPDPLRHSHPSP